MLTKAQYVALLMSTPVNYTCTNLADHLSDISHDSITDFLNKQRLTAQSVWSFTKALIRDTKDSFLIIDDSVQEKPYAKAIELVASHYSGNKHGVMRGITIVNLIHSAGDGDYYPIDDRIYAPDYAKKQRMIIFLRCSKMHSKFDIFVLCIVI